MIWNLESHKQKAKDQSAVRVLSNIHSKSIRNAIWSLNETGIVSASFDETCAFTDAETGKEVNRLRHDFILTSVATHLTDENMIICGSKDKVISWDVRTSKPAKVYKSSMGQVQDLLFLNEKEFVSCGDIVRYIPQEYFNGAFF